jgi:DNA polymerase-3 subunit alpha
LFLKLFINNISANNIIKDYQIEKISSNKFKNVNTIGVFQFGSPVAIPVLKKMQCSNMEELAAANSFIRPGTGGLDDYVNGKKNPNTIKKLDSRLDKHLSVTYGAVVFQEQVMSLIAELMGISFGQADIYRRALEKMHKPANKKKVEYFNNNVISIAKSRGFKEEEAEYIRKLITYGMRFIE